MSFPGFALGNQLEENARARNQELEDEQRKVTLKTLLENVDQASPDAAKQQHDIIQSVYHKDPGVLKQHVENLARRATGKQTQPVVSPAEAQQARVAPLAARGKMPEQQQSERAITDYKAMNAAQQQASDAAIQKALQVYEQQFPNATAEEKQRYFEALNGVKNYRPTSDDQKRADYQTLLASGQIPKDKAGNPLPYEQWAKTPMGVPDKPGTPRVGTSGGKNVYGLLTPDGWVDAGTKKPLADFRPLPNYAQIAPSMRAVQVVDPNNPDSTIYESIPEAIKNRSQGTQSAGFKMQMPTAQERGRADLAASAREQLGTMEGILQGRGDLFGPVSGKVTNFTQWIGSQDPDAQRFAAAARIASDHLAGVFGGRSQAALQAIYDVIGKNTTNPAAAVAGLEQMNIAASRIQSRGMGPAPKKEQHKVGEQKKFPNGKTGVWDGQGWVAQ